MTAETGAALGWGTTVVAALLWFAAFVALLRHDLGHPRTAAAIFAGAGAAVWLAGRGALYLTRHGGKGD